MKGGIQQALGEAEHVRATKIAVQKHFVEFISPGTFVAEASSQEIDSWNVEKAKEMARTVKERYGATPHSFRFYTMGRTADELNAKEIAKSCTYWLGGKVETAEEILARNDPSESILCSNIRINGYKRIIINNNSYRWTAPLGDDDVVLVWP